MKLVCVSAVLAVSFAGCGGQVTMDDAGTTPPSFDGLPCDVAAVLQNRCTSCHGAVPAGGAPYSLASRADLVQPAPAPYSAQTRVQRALARMASTTSPMPTAPASPATAAEQATVATWVDAGMPAGSCGPPPIICTSGITASAREGGSMRPGESCPACHRGSGEARVETFMGTVFPTAHERNDCEGTPPAGMVIEILSADSTARVMATLQVSSPSGNFYGNGTGVTMPYRARVRAANGKTREMLTPQTSGDCNSCHTELGTSGAPGRVYWPD